MVVGSVVIGMGLSVSAEETIPRTINEEVVLEDEELLVKPSSESEEPILIAPSPIEDDEVVIQILENNLEEEDELVIQILENQESNELVDTAGSNIKSSDEVKTAGLDIGIQALIIAGTVFVLLTALLVLKRKK